MTYNTNSNCAYGGSSQGSGYNSNEGGSQRTCVARGAFRCNGHCQGHCREDTFN